VSNLEQRNVGESVRKKGKISEKMVLQDPIHFLILYFLSFLSNAFLFPLLLWESINGFSRSCNKLEIDEETVINL